MMSIRNKKTNQKILDEEILVFMFMAGRPQRAASLAGALLIITPGHFI